jgi:kinetochore protein Mis13/DSN1
MFTRVKKTKQKNPEPAPAQIPQRPPPDTSRPTKIETTSNGGPATNGDAFKPSKKKPPKMSFSTPNPKDQQPLRRSRRISDEHESHDASPKPKARRKEDPPQEMRAFAMVALTSQESEKAAVREEVQPQTEATEIDRDPSATKIALPFADTPVIWRNKAMREKKSGKGERRSSLGLRGRRASSLIESGNSNALPHDEVEIPDFYKHIESDGLPEPRRMRQLLTWCATRSLDQKARGAEFEDASALAAARVIEEELLKELANRSELSDWFSREDTVAPPKELPERPNPKNLQNAEKITELEVQIRRYVTLPVSMQSPRLTGLRLRSERDALEALLQPPSIPDIPEQSVSRLDKSLLNDTDSAIFDSSRSNTNTSRDASSRLNSIQTSLGRSIDVFADGVHRVAQYRNAADSVAGTVLSVCSRKLTERELEGRRKALQDEDRSPRRDLNSVLRGLSRVDR